MATGFLPLSSKTSWLSLKLERPVKLRESRVSHLPLSHRQGGSYGRDAVLRGLVVVVFLDHLARFQDQKKIRQELLDPVGGG